MLALRSFYTQCFPPTPTFEPQNLPSQSKKVFIITGGNSGIGLELLKALYPTGATIYLACRSVDRAKEAIHQILSSNLTPKPSTPSTLKYLHLDLNDLARIPASAAEFSSQEERLDILWNNAGIAGAPVGTSTAQNIEGHVGINCVAHLLFTQLLLPQLRHAAASSPPNSVRVIWTASLSVEIYSPTGGIDFSLLNKQSVTESSARDYAASKVGNWFLAIECARRYTAYGIMSIVHNPGQLATDAWRYQSKLVMFIMGPTLHDKKLAAYTSLYAGFSADVGNSDYIMPWGRIMSKEYFPRKDILKAIDDGNAKRFWEWCQTKCRMYCVTQVAELTPRTR
jgi:NAD(P)-dependent dehydrogenase (short-subunit alcohol dehydrogenase family)